MTLERRLSSSGTFLHKFVLPLVWGVGFGFNTFSLLVVRHRDAALYALAWVVGMGLILRWSTSLKAVTTDGRFLYVSNYLRIEGIPLDNIEYVLGSRWMAGRPITVHFKHDTSFGRQVTFMPPFSWDNSFRGRNAAAEELRRLVFAARIVPSESEPGEPNGRA